MKLKDVLIIFLIVLICSLAGSTYALYEKVNEKNDEIDQLERKISKLTNSIQSMDDNNKEEQQKNTEKKQEKDSKELAATTKKEEKKEEKVYEIGETWTVDGQWSLTINSVTTTNERNQFSDKNPAQVVYITYSYENLGYEDDWGDGELYISIEMNSSIVDANGEVASSYPNSITTYPQNIPVGAKCINAQECIGLNNISDYITVNFSDYDANGKKQSAKFHLKVD